VLDVVVGLEVHDFMSIDLERVRWALSFSAELKYPTTLVPVGILGSRLH
jgi:hypothetical protein